MRDWVLFAIAFAGFVGSSYGAWFGLAVKAALGPLRERVLVLETQATETTRRMAEQEARVTERQNEILRIMERGFEQLGVDLMRIEGRIDRALNGKA